MMNTRIDRRSIDTAAGARRSFAPARRYAQPLVFSRTQLLVYVTLLLLLFASAFIPRAAAQNIYVGGLDSNDFTASIGEYAPDGTPINTAFVTLPRSYVQSLSISGNALVVPNGALSPLDGSILEYDTTTGTPLNFNIKIPYPVAAVVSGPNMWVLYDYPVRLAKYDVTTQKVKIHDVVPSGIVAAASHLAVWVDSQHNTHLYVTLDDDGSGNPYTGSILHILVPSVGPVTRNTVVAGLNYPRGIAISDDGQYVYVVDFQTIIQDDIGYFSKYSTTGGPAIYKVGALTQSPYGIALSGAALFVTGYGNGTVGEYYAATGAPINPSLVQGVSLPTAIAIGPPSCVPPPANMVAWYSFDKAGSTQKDLSSNNNPATAYSTTSVIGEVAGALRFNGTTSHVQAPATSANDLGTSDFSIDAWVRFGSGDDDGVVVVMDKRSTAGYHLYLYNRRVGLQMYDGNGYDNYSSGANAAVPADNQWHLIAVTVVRNSPTGGTWYLDGVSLGNFDPTAHQGSLSSAAPLEIGVRSQDLGGGGNFKGGIDEFEIFNRALGADEILALMQAGHAGKCK